MVQSIKKVTHDFNKVTGKVSQIKIDGKDVKKSYLNAFLKAQETRFFDAGILFCDERVPAQNPFSGATVELSPLEACIYQWCLDWYAQYERGKMPTPVSVYDNMRYLFMEMNVHAYMQLLD